MRLDMEKHFSPHALSKKTLTPPPPPRKYNIHTKNSNCCRCINACFKISPYNKVPFPCVQLGKLTCLSSTNRNNANNMSVYETPPCFVLQKVVPIPNLFGRTVMLALQDPLSTMNGHGRCFWNKHRTWNGSHLHLALKPNCR